MDSIALPPGYSFRFGGATKDMAEAFSYAISALALAVAAGVQRGVIDAAREAELVKALFEAAGFEHVIIVKDLSDRDRVVTNGPDPRTNPIPKM